MTAGPARRAVALALALTAALASTACGDRPASSAQTQRDVDAAAQKAKDAAVSAGHKAAELADKARDNTRAYFNSPEVKRDLSNAKDAVKDALDGRKAPPPDDASRK
jgi:hypothetical protein